MHLLCSPLQLFDLFLIFLILTELFLISFLPFHHIERIVPAVELGFAGGDFDTSLTHYIQVIAVMADGENGTMEMIDVVFQPFDGLHVQMVGWLVQK